MKSIPQLELEAAIEIIKKHGAVPAAPGQDVHCLTAAKIFGVKPEDVTPEQRRYAKTVNYAAMFYRPIPGAFP